MRSPVPEYDVLIRVKPELPWIRLVDEAARSYLKARAYPPRLVDQTIAAIVEASEQLIALCVERDITTSFEVGFLQRDEAVQVHMIYDTAIPLNPHLEKDYEVPSADEGVDHELGGLWLHILKRMMDRVFFRIDGKRASLVMMKYCRAEEQARQLWVMGLRPKLREDLMIERPADEGSRTSSNTAIIHDTRGRAVLKLSPSDTFIISRLNGQNTLHDIYLEHAAELWPISPYHIQQIYETLEAAGMLEGASDESARRKQRWQRWLSPVFNIPHPDAAVTRVYRYSRFIFNPMGVAVLVLAGLSGLIPLFLDRKELIAFLPRLDDLFFKHPFTFVPAYLIMLVQVAMHEFAHGVTCKHFGGKIRKMGVMWYLAMFIFFCDTSSAWSFPKKSQRIWVSLAGPLLSWAFFGAFAWCTALTLASASPYAALWFTLTLVNAFGILMNFNPLIRMDAYYMLVDWTDIPNLQKRAFAYLKAFVMGRPMRSEGAGELMPSAREKRIFLTYAVLSGAMSLLFIILPFWRLARLWIADRQLTVWGVMAFVVVTLLVARMLNKAHSLLHATRHREYRIS